MSKSVEARASALTPGASLTRDDAERLAGLLRLVAEPTRLQLLSMIIAAPSQ